MDPQSLLDPLGLGQADGGDFGIGEDHLGDLSMVGLSGAGRFLSSGSSDDRVGGDAALVLALVAGARDR